MHSYGFLGLVSQIASSAVIDGIILHKVSLEFDGQIFKIYIDP